MDVFETNSPHSSDDNISANISGIHAGIHAALSSSPQDQEENYAEYSEVSIEDEEEQEQEEIYQELVVERPRRHSVANDEGNEEIVVLSIDSTQSVNSKDEAYTVYDINYKFYSSEHEQGIERVVQKRFRQFYSLYLRLAAKYSHYTFTNWELSRVVNNKDEKVIEERRKSLEEYIKQWLDNKEIRTCHEIKMFFEVYELTRTVFIITGSNCGIGKELAITLAKQNAHVILACRNKTKGEKAQEEINEVTGKQNTLFMECDLASLNSIQKFADNFLSLGLPLHGLVNNAGVLGANGLTSDGFEIAFGTNFLGHVYLTDLLIDKLKECAPSKIVNVASKMEQKGRKIDFMAVRQEAHFPHTLRAYIQSKLAIVMITKEIARRLENSGVVVNSVHPGSCSTSAYKHLPKPVQWTLSKFYEHVEEGQHPILNILLTDTKNGDYFRGIQTHEPNPLALDQDQCTKLYEYTQMWIKSVLSGKKEDEEILEDN